MAAYSKVGVSVPRLDAIEKVTGRATYCTDLSFPGMLHGKVLRSSQAHAKIVYIDTSEAKRLRGVRAVITGQDVPVKRIGGYIKDQHMLARTTVRYVGDPVAAVAADTPEIAEKAIKLIKVEYQSLPAVFDLEAAWSKNPPVVIHPDLPKYDAIQGRKGQGLFRRLNPDRPNVCNHHKIRHGDVLKGFQEADIVIENKFSAARIQHCPFEPHVCIAKVETDGGITIWAGRQSIYRVRGYLCSAFELPPSKVRVISSHYIGGGFGNKADLLVEPIASLLAMKTERPVRLVFSREEMFTSGGTRIPMVVHIKDGARKDGTLVAREIKALLNVGAYAGSGAIITRNCCFGAVGSYRIPNFKMDSYGVYVNETIVTPFRGFGTSQILWAIESHMDMLADKLGLDAVSLRQKNLLEEGEVNVNGEIVHSIGAKECLAQVAEHIEWNRKAPESKGYWRRGKGLAVGNKYSVAPTDAVAIVKVWEDGTVEIRHSADEMGQGVNTVLAQIAAEEFQIEMDKTKVVWGDTSSTPHFPHGSTSHRTTYELGKAVYLACQNAKQQLFDIAAEKLKTSPDGLVTEKGRVFVKLDPSVSVTIPELFTDGYVEKGGEILGKDIWIQHYAPEDPETGQIDPELAKKGLRQAAFYGHSAQAVEVAVNTATGEVKILKAFAATDMGFPINPKMCEQQMEGGLCMGIGSALYEEMKMHNGEVLNPNWRDYKIPVAVNLPRLENFWTSMAPAPHKDGPYGAKGAGETQMTPSAPAIGNAIFNAVGIRIKDLPMTRERIFRKLKEKKQ